MDGQSRAKLVSAGYAIFRTRETHSISTGVPMTIEIREMSKRGQWVLYGTYPTKAARERAWKELAKGDKNLMEGFGRRSMRQTIATGTVDKHTGKTMVKPIELTWEGTGLEKQGKEQSALLLIVQEYRQAARQHSTFNSAHEGYAIILEELDELKAEVWKKKANRDIGLMRKEASHVAAMALRFILDVCVEGEKP